MFTWRAEYRLLLRQDNADVRLTPIAHKLGLASDERMARVSEKTTNYTSIINHFKTTSGEPEVLNPFLETMGSAPLSQKTRLFNVLSRPNISTPDLANTDSNLKTFLSPFDTETIEQAEILMKYEGYI